MHWFRCAPLNSRSWSAAQITTGVIQWRITYWAYSSLLQTHGQGRTLWREIGTKLLLASQVAEDYGGYDDSRTVDNIVWTTIRTITYIWLLQRWTVLSEEIESRAPPLHSPPVWKASWGENTRSLNLHVIRITLHGFLYNLDSSCWDNCWSIRWS